MDLQNQQSQNKLDLLIQTSFNATTRTDSNEQESTRAFFKNIDNINSGINKTYMQEQAKTEEAKTKLHFKSSYSG